MTCYYSVVAHCFSLPFQSQRDASKKEMHPRLALFYAF